MAKSLASDISLFDELRGGGYEASLITTYNIYLPFYEEVILRSLRASGCRHNVVLADHGQCAQAVRDTSYRPGAVGVEYTLVPMRVKPGSSFHPKIIFLAGPKKILILVGSHNLTISGFGYNRELTNRIEVLKGSDPSSLQLAAAVWRTLADWLHHQEESLPEELIKAALSVRDSAGWFKIEEKPISSPFLASAPGRASLWDQVKRSIKQRPKRVAIIGPFFDENFSFVRRITQDLKPSQIVIGIEPETVSLGKVSRLDKTVKLVDATFLGKKSGYLHAKALLLEFKAGEHVLAIGSANPGFAAWLRPGVASNTEAIILHSGKRAKDLAERLGLNRLFEQSPIAYKNLKEIETRSVARRRTELTDDVGPLVVAAETNDGFRIRAKCIDGKVQEARLLDVSRHNILTIKRFTRSNEYISMSVSDRETRSKTHEIEFVHASGSVILVLVHHTGEVRSLSQSNQQMQFRAALASLSGDSPDLAKLISTVEKVIFDDAQFPRSTGFRIGKAAKPSPRPESLGVDLDGITSLSKSRRFIQSGDIAYLLDALIYRLGIGLVSQSEQVDLQGRSEEEQRDQDDERKDSIREVLTDYKLAEICRRKVHTLVSRMIKQLELASSADPDPATSCLIQLLAVLATLRELRILENHPRWSSLRMLLVTEDDKYNLLQGASAYLYGPKHCLMNRALKEIGGDRLPDEVVRLPGLLLWLAWECGLNLNEDKVFNEDIEDSRRRIYEKAVLFPLVTSLSLDAIALREANESILKTSSLNQLAGAKAWLSRHINWGQRISSRIAHFTDLPTKVGNPEPGDFAYVTSLKYHVLSVVISSTNGSVGLVDLSSENRERRYTRDKVAVIQLL